MRLDVVSIKDIGGQMVGITLYEGHTTLPSSEVDAPILILSDDEDNQYALGYLTNISQGGVRKHIQKPMYGVYGSTENDLYNNIDNVDIINIVSKKKRDVVKGTTIYIGDAFASGTSANYGFIDNEFWTDVNITEKSVAPIAPASLSEAFTVLADGGGKFYLSTSGTLQEAEAYRINVGTRTTQIVSHDTWTPATLKATNIEDAVTTIFDALSTYGKGTGLPLSNAYEIYNIEDDTLYQMASGSVNIINYGASASDFSQILWEDTGVSIKVDATRTIVIDVGGTTSLVIENGIITLTAADFEWVGDLHVTGTLNVDGQTTLADTDVVGAYTVTGSSDLA